MESRFLSISVAVNWITAANVIFDRAQLSKAYETAGILFEVFINGSGKVEEVAPEVSSSPACCQFQYKC